MVEAGGSLRVDGSISNGGTFQTTGGTFTIDGAVSGGGGVAEIDGGTLMFEKNFNQKVKFEGTGVLALAKSAAFKKDVSGFSGTGGTIFDLMDIRYSTGVEVNYAGNSTSEV